MGVKVLDYLYYKSVTDYTPLRRSSHSILALLIRGQQCRGPHPALAKALMKWATEAVRFSTTWQRPGKTSLRRWDRKPLKDLSAFSKIQRYRKEKWALDLCDVYEKYGVWEKTPGR
jgi:hypothetical protein